MIVCIPSKGPTVDSIMDDRFGRAGYFAFFDSDTDSVSILENIHAGGSGGVGTKVVQFLIQKRVDLLIAPRIGGNAEEALKAGSIQVIIQDPVIKVEEAYYSWKKSLK
jgi:predicted Fe-Mo cluster-binding NifX family protein